MKDIEIAKYEDLEIGDSASVTHTITENDIETFGNLSGDYNPLHFNEEWAKKTMFKGRIAHGVLTAAYVSAAIGMKLPGPGTIYLSQSMRFRRPVRIGDTITATVEVIGKEDEKEQITLGTMVTNQEDEIVLQGDAVIMLMKEE
jgi:3-hydroxybutyryl-CoA dehydratase